MDAPALLLEKWKKIYKLLCEILDLFKGGDQKKLAEKSRELGRLLAEQVLLLKIEVGKIIIKSDFI